jgi:hypothetical protein
MDLITIEINALGYTGEDYEETETVLKKSVPKDTSSERLTESDCREVLQKMIVTVDAVKELYPDENEPANNKLVSIQFDITCKIDNAETSLDEEAFFREAAQHDSLADAILEYTKATDNGDEGIRIMMPENDNYESYPAGTFAILALALRDKKWIADYIAFLRTNDMDSEVMQLWDIKSIVEQYGWCEETTKLAIARNVSCCGQGGREQFEQFVEEGLADYLTKPENRKKFLSNIQQEFEEWRSLALYLEEESEKYYKKYVLSYVNHFEKALTKEEMKVLEKFLIQKWDAYHTK